MLHPFIAIQLHPKYVVLQVSTLGDAPRCAMPAPYHPMAGHTVSCHAMSPAMPCHGAARHSTMQSNHYAASVSPVHHSSWHWPHKQRAMLIYSGRVMYRAAAPVPTDIQHDGPDVSIVSTASSAAPVQITMALESGPVWIDLHCCRPVRLSWEICIIVMASF